MLSKVNQYVTFYVDELFFGIDIRIVSEVNPSTDLMPIPLSESHISGLVNIRGQVVLVMDVKSIFSKIDSVITEKSHIIILKTKDELSNSMSLNGNFTVERYSDKLCAFLVDMIGDVITISVDKIEAPTLQTDHVNHKFISGVVQLRNRLLIILNPAELLWYKMEEPEPLQL